MNYSSSESGKPNVLILFLLPLLWKRILPQGKRISRKTNKDSRYIYISYHPLLYLLFAYSPSSQTLLTLQKVFSNESLPGRTNPFLPSVTEYKSQFLCKDAIPEFDSCQCMWCNFVLFQISFNNMRISLLV